MDTKQAEQELSVIRTIMEDSRKIIVDTGKHYIFWGVLVSAALFINYGMLLYNISGQYQGMMWFILMTLGWITAAIIEKKEEKRRKVQTFAGKLLGSLWIASGISMMIFGFVGTASHAYNPVFICPIISTLLGVSYYTSGAIQSLKWLQFLSLGWWIGAAALFVFPSIHTLLIFGLMMLAFQTVPGIILYKRWKRESIIPGSAV